MIKSTGDNISAMNAFGGAGDGKPVKLHSGCWTGNKDCTWTWSKGELFSDSISTLAIRPSGRAANNVGLIMSSGCTTSNSDCVFGTSYKGELSVDISSPLRWTPYLSRISTDATSSKVRLVYPSVNENRMEEARVVDFDASDPTHPVSVTTIRPSFPEDHSVLYATFIDPDYLDMPPDARSNTSMLYWLDVPTPGTDKHDYTARYVTISGDNAVTATSHLSVQNGIPRSWNSRADLGDYVTGGFYWRNKTLNYVAHWPEPGALVANVVTIKPGPTGFSIQSEISAGLMVKAPGADEGIQPTTSTACATDMTDCRWSYHDGMIVSDTDPGLALNAWGGASDGIALRLTRFCAPSNPDCTWTYQDGLFWSDNHASGQNLAIDAGGPGLALSAACDKTKARCRFSLLHVLLSSATDQRLGVNAWGGAQHGAPLKLHKDCALANPDCTWTFTKGMILSDRDPSLAVNALGGADQFTQVALHNACAVTNKDCTWTWSHGELTSDNKTKAPHLGMNAFGGAKQGAELRLHNACSSANPDCVFSAFFGR
jgi:hypothetical protein